MTVRWMSGLRSHENPYGLPYLILSSVLVLLLKILSVTCLIVKDSHIFKWMLISVSHISFDDVEQISGQRRISKLSSTQNERTFLSSDASVTC